MLNKKYQYASMDQISEMIPAVLQFFNFRTIIGVGVGAGAYILSKFTLTNPEAVEGLVLVNVDTNARGWMDWAAQKEEMSANTDLIQTHRERIAKAPNLINIELFWKSYQGRRDLNIDRNNMFKCPVMLVVGDQAPYEEAAVECNSKLDPTTTSFLKMADAGGMPQLTQPSKLTEAFNGVLLHDAPVALAHHVALVLLLHGGLALEIPHAVPGLAGRTTPAEPVPYHGGVVLRSAREGERDGRMKRLSLLGGGKQVSCMATDGRMMTTLSLPLPTRQADDRAL
ncbi:Protein NDRG2 [Labeo rohita]|uniref:Protein NDRG2 n=1 Tax=Labeo rohita TaxID=84645 RepID=A0ABQ8MJN0_LABRO|nr:Protein NDRG2 [Labeo rohita]